MQRKKFGVCGVAPLCATSPSISFSLFILPSPTS